MALSQGRSFHWSVGVPKDQETQLRLDAKLYTMKIQPAKTFRRPITKLYKTTQRIFETVNEFRVLCFFFSLLRKVGGHE